MSELLTLPENALMRVLSRLHYKDLMNVAFTCHLLQGLALSDYLWMRLCEPWKVHVDLEKWRAAADSARSVFRLLSSFSKLVGHWSAPGLEPRGGLLFVAWGNLSVIAYRIVILETADLKMQHLFDVVDVPSYCTTTNTKIFTTCSTPAGRRGLSLSGALVWSSPDDEFYLELAEHCEASIHDMKQPDALSRPETTSVVTDNDRGTIPSDALQLSHIMKSLDTSFGIGQYADEDEEDCVSVDGNFQVLHIASAREIAGSLYKRLIVEEARKEIPFAGLWAGLYGAHGMEIVNISYTSEEIIATKVLGDANVPCGQMTFKAKIATESSEISPRLQAIMNAEYADVSPFVIVKLYEGCGQIADTGFENPQWVPGKLLVDQENVIAFLWEDYYFSITYQKLHVPSIYERRKESLVNSIM